MFSYRHGFHAGNHADVLKHITLLATIRLLHKKPTPLLLIDTHAGAGLYDLQDRFAMTSQEAHEGVLALNTYSQNKKTSILPQGIEDYLQEILRHNFSKEQTRYYPGSSQLFLQTLRQDDKLRLFELHPSDFPLLQKDIKHYQQSQNLARQDIQIQHSNGFNGLKAFLPPPTRRGLCLIDPSYEDQQDYLFVMRALESAIKRFATGVYLVWYPILTNKNAQNLPKKLQAFCTEKNLPYLQAELQIKQMTTSSGLAASGMWVINPPWQLQQMLEDVLPFLKEALGLDQAANTRLFSTTED